MTNEATKIMFAPKVKYTPLARAPCFSGRAMLQLSREISWREDKMSTPVMDKVIEQLRALPDELQWRVLEFTRALAVSVPHGVPGRQLLGFAGVIQPDDLDRMRQAIEEGCEQVDVHEW
jgi:hypothetical protein